MKTEPDKQQKTTTLSQVIELTCEYLGHQDRTRETTENNNPFTSNRVNMWILRPWRQNLVLILYDTYYLVKVFIVCLYLYLPDTIMKKSRVEITSCGLTPPHLCACLNPGPGFPTLCVMVFCVFSDLRWDAFVQFVDIGRFPDHHCLKFHLKFHFIKVIWDE